MEGLFDWPIFPLVGGLLALMFLADEIGFRYGQRNRNEPESSRNVTGALKGSVFGMVALLLGFSFSATSTKHEQRRRMVLDEANAIGTCHLRASLLDKPSRALIQDLLRRYLNARLEYHDVGLNLDQRRKYSEEMDLYLQQVWEAIAETNRKNSQSVLTSQIIPAANEVIDLNGTRAWLSQNHVPAPIMVLLFVSVLVSSLLIGHSSGQIGQRHVGLWIAFNVLFVLVLFVVIDLDSPLRGMIRVEHHALRDLQSSLRQTASP